LSRVQTSIEAIASTPLSLIVEKGEPKRVAKEELVRTGGGA
jgi:hypothetical protein